jgi:hypothetical protein
MAQRIRVSFSRVMSPKPSSLLTYRLRVDLFRITMIVYKVVSFDLLSRLPLIVLVFIVAEFCNQLTWRFSFKVCSCLSLLLERFLLFFILIVGSVLPFSNIISASSIILIDSSPCIYWNGIRSIILQIFIIFLNVFISNIILLFRTVPLEFLFIIRVASLLLHSIRLLHESSTSPASISRLF